MPYPVPCSVRASRASRRAPVPALSLALALAVALVLPARILEAEEGPAGGGLAAGSLPPLVEGGPAFQLPSGDPRALYRRAPEAAPLPVRAFWEAAAPAAWGVHWDPLLETPYLVYPLGSHELASPEAVGSADPEELVTSVRSFMEEHAELFGIEPEELSPASVIALGPHKVVRFSQRTRSGIPLRGAGLRVVVRADGRLGWVKAFLAREAPEPPEPAALLDEGRVTALSSGLGARLLRAELQMAYLDGASLAATACWVLALEEEDGRESECFVDAVTGEVRARRRLTRHFEGEAGGAGGGAGNAAGGGAGAPAAGTARGLTNAWSETGALDVIPGAMIREGTTEELIDPDRGGRIAGVSRADGAFEVPARDDPTTLTASLEHLRCRPETPDCFPAAPGDPTFTSIFRIKLDKSSLLPGEDVDDVEGTADIPDAQAAGPLSERFALTFHAAAATPGDIAERSWWTRLHKASFETVDFVYRVLDSLEMAAQPFAPFACFEILPFSESIVVLDVLEILISPACSLLYHTRSLPPLDPDGTLRRDLPRELVPVTLTTHELGHQVLFNMTGTVDGTYPDIEEGVADAITAMVHADPGIGFLEGGVQTTRGFILGRRSPEDPAFPGYLDRVRTPGRRAVGNAFWELHRTLRNDADRPLEQGEITHGARLLLAWLGLNRATEAHERLFGPAGNLLVELFLVDDLVDTRGDGVLANGSPNDREIRAAFLRTQLFDPHFIRGDADGDGRLNLTDLFAILSFLFAFAPDEVPFHDCMNALDADDSSEVDLGDVLFLANWLFLNEAGTLVLPRPGAVCGFERGEPWEPTSIGCRETSCPSDLPE